MILTEELGNGRRKLTHPSGVVVFESLAQRRRQRSVIADLITELMAQLKDFDKTSPPEVRQ